MRNNAYNVIAQSGGIGVETRLGARASPCACAGEVVEGGGGRERERERGRERGREREGVGEGVEGSDKSYNLHRLR